MGENEPVTILLCMVAAMAMAMVIQCSQGYKEVCTHALAFLYTTSLHAHKYSNINFVKPHEMTSFTLHQYKPFPIIPPGSDPPLVYLWCKRHSIGVVFFFL